MSANINCFNGLELSISDFCFVRLSVRLFLSKFWKKCQKIIRDAFKKKVNFGTLAQKGGGGQSKIPNVDQY